VKKDERERGGEKGRKKKKDKDTGT